MLKAGEFHSRRAWPIYPMLVGLPLLPTLGWLCNLLCPLHTPVMSGKQYGLVAKETRVLVLVPVRLSFLL